MGRRGRRAWGLPGKTTFPFSRVGLPVPHLSANCVHTSLPPTPAPHTQNMAAQYEAHGYLYEQYNDATGRGSGSHPFNGWSALVALVAVEA